MGTCEGGDACRLGSRARTAVSGRESSQFPRHCGNDLVDAIDLDSSDDRRIVAATTTSCLKAHGGGNGEAREVDIKAYTGSCRCGAVGIALRGEPLRVGICHRTDCRQESGSAFTFYGIWPTDRFELVGATGEFDGRRFCTTCGSRLISVDAREAEIKLGVLVTAPTPFTPSYELWVRRREPWLRPIDGAIQHDQDRP